MVRFLRTRPAWVDAAVAFVLSVAAVWLALKMGGDTSSVLNTDTDTDTDAGPVRESDPARPSPHPPQTRDDGIALDPATAAMLSLLVTVPLAWRRRWPIAVFAVQFAGAVLTGTAGSARVIFVSVLIGAYSCAVHGRPAWLSVGTIAAACTAVALTFSEVTPPIPGWASSFAILMPIALFGLAIRSARARADAIADRAEALRRSQEASTAAAVASERAMIARELHDIVSHHVSVMVIQAGAAEKVLSTKPGETRESLRAIAGSGREAMGELRHLLGVLAPPPGETDHPASDPATAHAHLPARADPDIPLRPQPGLDQLQALVAKVRSAGQPVALQCESGSLSPGIDTTAYRIVREALTNALRYAPGAPTAVRVTSDGSVLTVEVTDDGAPARLPATRGAGSGLLGLSERVALYGGTLQAGRRISGGFRVRARIPLGAAS